MSEPRFMLATADEIRAIHGRAKAFIDVILERARHRWERSLDEEGYDKATLRRNLRRGTEALRFCCFAAGQLADPSLLPLVMDALKTCEDFEPNAPGNREMMGRALTSLLRVGAPIDGTVKELAAHKHPEIREAIARGLLARNDAEIALLESLADDSIPDVRAVAKQALSSVREVPWWRGKFRKDPLSVLSEGEATRLKRVLESISKILDQPLYIVEAHEGKFRELVRALPDGLLVDLVETIHTGADPYNTRLYTWLTLMLERPGGVDAWKRLLDRWSRERHSRPSEEELAKVVEALPSDIRLSVCKELATHAAGAPDDEASRGLWTAAQFAAATAGRAWPPEADVTPVLDLLLSMPPSPPERRWGDYVKNGLQRAFRTDSVLPAATFERVIEARVAGYPGSWTDVARSMDRLLQCAPRSVVRGAAERAIVGDDKGTVEWGLTRLLGDVFDPERDGPKEALLRRFMSEPKYRPHFESSSDLRELALPLLREELRAGALALDEAAEIIRMIAARFGGATKVYPSEGPNDEEEREASVSNEEREPVTAEDVIGAAPQDGPITEDEWRAFRRARAPWIEGGLEPYRVARRALRFPMGPFCPEDRATIDKAIDVLREKGASACVLALPIAGALCAEPSREALELFGSLVVPNSHPAERSDVRTFRGKIERALGIIPTPSAGVTVMDDMADWIDEPDDDEPDDEGDDDDEL